MSKKHYKIVSKNVDKDYTTLQLYRLKPFFWNLSLCTMCYLKEITVQQKCYGISYHIIYSDWSSFSIKYGLYPTAFFTLLTTSFFSTLLYIININTSCNCFHNSLDQYNY